MDQRKDAETRFWIPDRDSLGNPVDKRLSEAAQNIWERARLVVLRYLGDDEDAADILEAAVDSVSRVMNSPNSIEFFKAYLLRSVARESIRRSRRYRRLQYMDGKEIERLAGAVSADIEKQLDDAKRMQIFRACLDERGRIVYDLRRLDFDWRSIAKFTGYSDAHSAKVQFRKKIEKALKRFRAYHDLRLRPPSGV